MIELATRCPKCSHHVIASNAHGFWICLCPNCIDPDGDSHYEHLQGKGSTPEAALDDWWESMDEGDEPQYRPNPLRDFIVPLPPEGWVLEPRPEDMEGPLYYGPPTVHRKAANDT